ncbi:hypothetical protein LQ757_05920 [Agromyces sp. SYSU K20354]|nr:hypothetical protein [Agromyces cavernae]MCD2441813.1 hypothetical protein [Agromyces cavernae]
MSIISPRRGKASTRGKAVFEAKVKIRLSLEVVLAVGVGTIPFWIIALQR